MLKPGDKVRMREGHFSWANKPGDTGVFQGGADYVPGLDAGCYTVTLDKPNLYGHRAAAHWTYEEACSVWELA